MTRFIVYYRVSTDKQGKSGLGLDAQRQAVAEHTEIESTRNKRLELCAALEAYRKHKANRLTIHILAAVAEHEREMIFKRAKAALRAAKARGIVLDKRILAR